MATISVDRLEPGDHACLTFSDPQERSDLLTAFVEAGVARGEKVICFTETAVPQAAGLPTQRWWAEGEQPDARVMVRRLADEVAKAEAEGRTGLRITTDMCWAALPQAGAEQLLAFENEVSTLFADGRLTAVCEYDRESFDPVTLAYAARVHPRTVAATVYHHDPVLRICRQHVPPGVRVAGELDYSGADALRDALAEAVRLDPDVHLNLSRLRFLDAGAAGVVLRAASSLPAGRQMVVVCATAIHRTLDLAGAQGVPQLKVVSRDA
ncbi:MEDS domain-containing protein [Micromonosporaceae bacterium Da 78-11]